jgi:hypothetical protein
MCRRILRQQRRQRCFERRSGGRDKLPRRPSAQPPAHPSAAARVGGVRPRAPPTRAAHAASAAATKPNAVAQAALHEQGTMRHRKCAAARLPCAPCAARRSTPRRLIAQA